MTVSKMRAGAVLVVLGTLAACQEPMPTRLNFDWDAFVAADAASYHKEAQPQPRPAQIAEEPVRPVTRPAAIEAESLAPPPQPRPKTIKTYQNAPIRTAEEADAPVADQSSAEPAKLPAPHVRPSYSTPKTVAKTSPQVETPEEDAVVAEKTTKPVKTASLGGGHFAWPAHGKVIGEFGAEGEGQRNDGINIAAAAGTPITAAADGTVGYAGSEMKSYGNLVVIRHDGGFFTAYAHASKILVKSGDHVTAGQTIGYVGQTGDVDSPQLHFEIRKGREPQDPKKFLSTKG